MPLIDLLIVDEAHKLKNPGALRTQAMRSAFPERFRKTLFLTATPFQLDVSELREIISLFSGARDAPPDIEDRISKLLDAVIEYQRHYDLFQQTWSALEPTFAAKFRLAYDGRSPMESIEPEPALTIVESQITALKTLKNEVIEPGFRYWMIRSLREDKRLYRRHDRRSVRSNGASALPFLLYERFIAELFRRGRPTHKAAVEINMVSSYAAAHKGDLLSSDVEVLPAEARPYKSLLNDVLGRIDQGAHDHPKIGATIVDALDAADAGEKTLIFCSRNSFGEISMRYGSSAFWRVGVGSTRGPRRTRYSTHEERATSVSEGAIRCCRRASIARKTLSISRCENPSCGRHLLHRNQMHCR